MIAIIIATLVCATIILTAYWLRDLALRWLDEGRASEEVAKLRAEVERVERRIDADVMPLCAGHGTAIDGVAVRLDEIEALARKAEASVREKNVGAALRGTGRS